MIVQQVGNRDRGFAVADELDYEIYQDRKQLPRRRGRATRLLLIVAALSVIAAGSAYGWLNYGRLDPASLARAKPGRRRRAKEHAKKRLH